MRRVEKNEEIAKKIEHEEKMKIYKSHAKKITKFLLITMFFVFSFFYYIRFIEPTMLLIKEIKIENSLIPKSLSGLKIVQFSDLHYKMTTGEKELKKMIQKINELKPDIFVFTGDLLDKKITYEEEDYEFLSEQFKEVNVSMSKYFIKGNQDYPDEKTDRILEKAGFSSLNNKNDKIYGNNTEQIQIIGLGSSIQNDFNIEKAWQDISDEVFTISLLHEPDNILKLQDKKIHLAIAGHSHNNQINIPYISQLFSKEGSKKYYNNYYQLGNTELFVNSGIGTSKSKFRLFAPPTINFYRLVNS